MKEAFETLTNFEPEKKGKNAKRGISSSQRIEHGELVRTPRAAERVRGGITKAPYVKGKTGN